MLLTSVSSRGPKWHAILYRILLACLYTGAAVSVFDYGTYFIAAAGGSGYRNNFYLSMLYISLAGAGVLAVAAVLAASGVRRYALCGLIGCLMQMPWLGMSLPDLICPHLPFVYYRVHIEPRTVRAAWMVIASSAVSVSTLYRNQSWRKRLGGSG